MNHGEHVSAQLPTSQRSHEGDLLTALALELCHLSDTGMDACPSAGEDIAEDNWFIRCHSVLNLSEIVNAPPCCPLLNWIIK